MDLDTQKRPTSNTYGYKRVTTDTPPHPTRERTLTKNNYIVMANKSENLFTSGLTNASAK